jgi:hypothetical protein
MGKQNIPTIESILEDNGFRWVDYGKMMPIEAIDVEKFKESLTRLQNLARIEELELASLDQSHYYKRKMLKRIEQLQALTKEEQ